MNTLLSTFHYVKNKLVAIVALIALATAYRNLPENHPVPFAEVLYAVVLVLSVAVLAPLMRLLVFNEAAQFAESGELDATLKEGVMSSSLVHYWIATIICYLTALLCVSSLLS